MSFKQRTFLSIATLEKNLNPLRPSAERHQKVDALCRIDVRCTSYSHWLSVTSGTRQRCYCSYGSAHAMKHCCCVGLLLGYYSTAWPLSPNYSKWWQCCVTDWTTFHCKYRTDRAKARPQKRCCMCYKPIIATLHVSTRYMSGRLL